MGPLSSMRRRFLRVRLQTPQCFRPSIALDLLKFPTHPPRRSSLYPAYLLALLQLLPQPPLLLPPLIQQAVLKEWTLLLRLPHFHLPLQ